MSQIFERVLARVGLRDQNLVDVNTEPGRITRVKGVLGVDESHDTTHGLGLGKNLKGQGGLTARLRPIDLDDTATGNAADAQGRIEGQGAGGDGFDLKMSPTIAKTHNGTLAESLLDL